MDQSRNFIYTPDDLSGLSGACSWSAIMCVKSRHQWLLEIRKGYWYFLKQLEVTQTANTLVFTLVNKISFSGNRCVQILNQSGQSCYLAMASIENLLKREQFILSAMKNVTANVPKCISTLENLLKNALDNYDKVLEGIIESKDIIGHKYFGTIWYTTTTTTIYFSW